MAPGKNTDVFGWIAIVVGGMLVLGALMFLTLVLFIDLPRLVLVPPVMQIVLGLLASTGGFLLRRGHAAAKFLLLFVAMGVAGNLVFLVSLILPLARG